MFNRIKSEYLILLLAWTFWAISGLITWKYYDPEAKFGFMISVRSIQFAFVYLYSVLSIQIFLFLLKKLKYKPLRFVLFPLVILLVSVLAVVSNTTTMNIMNNSPNVFASPKEVFMFTMQKVTFFTGFATIFFVLRNMKELQYQKKRTVEANKMAVEAQLQLLQQQINPHFLFNTLNSVRSLVSVDQNKAREMITDLSDFLRETLKKNNGQLITVNDEVRLLENYLSIQKMRFGPDLLIYYDVASAAGTTLIPAFIMQPLAENAIKHGMRSGVVLHLHIAISLTNNVLKIEVRNNGVLLGKVSGKCNGNTNLSKRLELLYGERACFRLFEDKPHVHAVVEIQNPQNRK